MGFVSLVTDVSCVADVVCDILGTLGRGVGFEEGFGTCDSAVTLGTLKSTGGEERDCEGCGGEDDVEVVDDVEERGDSEEEFEIDVDIGREERKILGSSVPAHELEGRMKQRQYSVKEEVEWSK